MIVKGQSRSRRRALITGIGVVAPNGVGRDRFWQRSQHADCCLTALDRFPSRGYVCRVAGQVEGFIARDFVAPNVIKQTDRSTHMAMAACKLATDDAALDLAEQPPEDVGMVFANVFGGMEFAERELYAQWLVGADRVSAYQSIAWFYAATQGQWSIANGLRGYAKSIVGDRAGGHQAMLLALMMIREERASMIYCGGFEAPLAPYAYRIHESAGLLSGCRDPATAFKPFDAARSGLVLAEGAAVLLIEEAERAARRGARVYAELAGGAMTFGAGDGMAGDPLVAALTEALTDGGGGVVDVALPEGLAVRSADVREARAIATAFEGHLPRISLPKAATGHALAAAGALDAAWAALMIRHDVLLPAHHLRRPDVEVEFEYTAAAEHAAGIDTVVCSGTGFGGVNAAVLLRRYRRPGEQGDPGKVRA